jgi:hypothetical protein
MRKLSIELVGTVLCTLLVAVPMVAANQARQTPAHQTQAAESTRSAWPPETLSGNIMKVVPTQNLLIVKGPDGVPFDMVVTGSTSIKAGNQKLTLDQLHADNGKSVSVRFVPEPSGDIARSIQVMS